MIEGRLAARRAAGLVAAAAIAIGCASPTRQSEAPTGGTPVARATASPSAAVASPATPPPTAKPSAVAPAMLDVRWTAHDPSGLSRVMSIIGVARNADRYVLVAELPSNEGEAFAAWSSVDGQAWKLAHEFPDNERILALTAGGPGFVVSGFTEGVGVVWTSRDGLDWERITDASLRGGVINQLVSTASGVVGFGWRYAPDEVNAIWTSPDGFEWLAATNPTGVRVARGLQAVGAYDGRAVAFVSEGDRKPPAIWETTGRAEWTRTGSLPDAGTVDRVAGGTKGWVAVGSNKAWTSPDGRSWSKGVSGPDVSADVIVDQAGYVAVGFVGSLPGETCGDQRPFEGHTWTSVDGRRWRRMPVTGEFKSAMVLRLLAVDRTLIGYGNRIGAAETMAIARWTAPLPDLSKPASASDKPSVARTCGG